MFLTYIPPSFLSLDTYSITLNCSKRATLTVPINFRLFLHFLSSVNTRANNLLTLNFFQSRHVSLYIYVTTVFLHFYTKENSRNIFNSSFFLLNFTRTFILFVELFTEELNVFFMISIEKFFSGPIS